MQDSSHVSGQIFGTGHTEIIWRRWIAILAALFPVVFLASSFIFGRTEFQPSLSHYYWTLDVERNFFVGILFFVSAYLLLFKGFTWKHDRVLDLAGICAAGVAFFPTDKCVECESGISAHGVFAVVFFSCLFYVCIFMSDFTLRHLEKKKQAFYRRWYWACASVMIGLIVLAVIFNFLPHEYGKDLLGGHIVFWFEAVGIWAFSLYWYIKSRELDQSLSWVPFMKKK